MRRLSAHHLAPDNALGVLHRNPALAALHVDDEGDNQYHDADQQDGRRRGKYSPGIGADLVEKVDDAARQADHDAGKDQQRHAVADATLGDLLAQPHDEGAARGQGQHGHQDERRAGMDNKISAALQLPGNTE